MTKLPCCHDEIDDFLNVIMWKLLAYGCSPSQRETVSLRKLASHPRLARSSLFPRTCASSSALFWPLLQVMCKFLALKTSIHLHVANSSSRSGRAALRPPPSSFFLFPLALSSWSFLKGNKFTQHEDSTLCITIRMCVLLYQYLQLGMWPHRNRFKADLFMPFTSLAGNPSTVLETK